MLARERSMVARKVARAWSNFASNCSRSSHHIWPPCFIWPDVFSGQQSAFRFRALHLAPDSLQFFSTRKPSRSARFSSVTFDSVVGVLVTLHTLAPHPDGNLDYTLGDGGFRSSIRLRITSSVIKREAFERAPTFEHPAERYSSVAVSPLTIFSAPRKASQDEGQRVLVEARRHIEQLALVKNCFGFARVISRPPPPRAPASARPRARGRRSGAPWLH